MRTFVVTSLTVLMLMCGANAGASGWRDLRIDASSDSRFDASIQQMRDELPYNRALLFGLILQDLKARLTPTEYRAQLDGLEYKQIAHLASPNVMAQYLAHYGGGQSPGSSVDSGSSPFTGVANPFGAFPGFDQTTGRQLPAP
jgi:hypothetical protein